MNDELRKLIEKAEAGDAKAAAWAGECFNKGLFTEKDDVKAHEYYFMAAQGGHAKATFMVGLGFLFGTGVDKNIPEGLKYIQKAADNNVAEAQYILALCYDDENKRKHLDGNKKFYYLEKSAKQGWAPAQVLLGDMYYLGEGVKEDLKKTIFWFCCAYLHKEDDEEIKKASTEAEERIEFLIQSGLPGGRERIKEVFAQIKRDYPQYISSDKRYESKTKNCVNANGKNITSSSLNDNKNAEKRNSERGSDLAILILFVIIIVLVMIFTK